MSFVTLSVDDPQITVVVEQPIIEIEVGGLPGPPGRDGADGQDGAPGEPGPPGGIQARQTSSIITAALTNGQTEIGTSPLAASYRLLHLGTNAPARLRLYTSAAKRDADALRPIGTDPTGDHGLMLEFVTIAGLLSADLSPIVDGFVSSGTSVFYAITNSSGGTSTITVTLDWIRTE